MAVMLALHASASDSSHVEHGAGATYHYDDWRDQPPQKAFDVAPAPTGGMHAFISRLNYPSELRRRHVGGVMRVFVSLDTRGQVKEVKILHSIDPSLDRIVLEAVRTTRWNPALKNKKPIAVKFAFPLTFRP